VHTPLVVIDHRDVHAVLVVHQLLALLETLVLEVKTVFAQLAVEVLSHAVKSLMYEHDAENGSHQVQDAVDGVVAQDRSPVSRLQETAQDRQQNTQYARICHLLMNIEVQTSACRRTDTGDDDTDEFQYLAYHHGTKHLQLSKDGNESLHDGRTYANGHVYDEFQNQEDIDATPEKIVYLLLFVRFLYHNATDYFLTSIPANH